MLGTVNCVPDFEKHPYVINGCSELFAKIWGEDNGVGVRSAVGMGSLPNNISVEIRSPLRIALNPAAYCKQLSKQRCIFGRKDFRLIYCILSARSVSRCCYFLECIKSAYSAGNFLSRRSPEAND